LTKPDIYFKELVQASVAYRVVMSAIVAIGMCIFIVPLYLATSSNLYKNPVAAIIYLLSVAVIYFVMSRTYGVRIVLSEKLQFDRSKDYVLRIRGTGKGQDTSIPCRDIVNLETVSYLSRGQTTNYQMDEGVTGFEASVEGYSGGGLAVTYRYKSLIGKGIMVVVFPTLGPTKLLGVLEECRKP
jgi:hypothetical protein